MTTLNCQQCAMFNFKLTDHEVDDRSKLFYTKHKIKSSYLDKIYPFKYTNYNTTHISFSFWSYRRSSLGNLKRPYIFCVYIPLYHSLQWNTKIKLFNISSERGVYYTVHSQGVYGLIVNENNEVNICLMIVKMI